MPGSNVGEAWYEIEARQNKLRQSLDAADKRVDATAKHAEKSLGGRITGALGGLGSAIGSTLKVAAIGGGAAVAALGAIAIPAVKGATEWETYNAQFAALLGTADKAQERMKQLADFGARTPFELTEIVQADKVLTAFGVHSQRNLEAVGNAAAASGQSYSDVATTFARVTAGQFGEAFQRLAEMGVATRKDLEMEGLKFDKAGSFTGSAEQATEAVTRIIEKKFGAHGDVPSMMDAMSNTTAGQFSNLQDNIAALFRNVGAVILPLVRTLIDGLNKAMPVIQQVLIDTFERVGPIMKVVGDVIGQVMGTITSAFSGSGAAGNQFGDVMKTVGGIVQTIIAAWQQNWPTVQALIVNVMTIVRNIVAQVVPIIAELFSYVAKNVLPALLEAFNGIATWVVANWPMISGVIQAAGRVIIGAIKLIWPIIENTARVVFPLIGAALSLLLPVVEGVLNDIGTAFEVMSKLVGIAIDVITTIIDGVISFFQGTFLPAFDRIGETFSAVWQAVAGFFTSIWNGMLQVVGSIVGTMIGIIKNVVGIAADIPGPWQDGAKKQKAALESMESAAKSWGKNTQTTMTTSYREQRRLAAQYGSSTAQAYADGFAGMGGYYAQKVATFQASGRRYLQSASPPKEGPLHNIDKWAVNTARTYADAFASQGAYIGRAIASALTPAAGTVAAAPGVSGGTAVSAPVSSGGGIGGMLSVNVQFQSLVAPTPAQGQAVARAIAPELVRELRRTGVSI